MIILKETKCWVTKCTGLLHGWITEIQLYFVFLNLNIFKYYIHFLSNIVKNILRPLTNIYN